MSRRLLIPLLAVALLIAAGAALAAENGLILPTHTPGARYSIVTQKTLFKTVCRVGWTATIRPLASYTSALKRKQLALFHYADRNPSHYEEDHLISLEHGELLVEQDRPDEAALLVAEARATFDRLEATPWSERARQASREGREPEPVAS